jgi:hypothetical protein
MRRHHDPRAAEDALSWTIAAYERAMLRDRPLSDLLDDANLKARHAFVHEAARLLLEP